MSRVPGTLGLTGCSSGLVVLVVLLLFVVVPFSLPSFFILLVVGPIQVSSEVSIKRKQAPPNKKPARRKPPSGPGFSSNPEFKDNYRRFII